MEQTRMNAKPLLAMLAIISLNNPASGQSPRTDSLDAFGKEKFHIVVSKKDKKSGTVLIVLGVLLIATFKVPEGSGGSDYGNDDPMLVYLGAGLIALGFNKLPDQHSWMPSFSFERRKSTIQWTVFRF